MVGIHVCQVDDLGGVMYSPVRCIISNESPNVNGAIDLNELTLVANSHVAYRIPEVDIDHLNGWRILILVTIRNTSQIGIFKRARRYPSEKEFEFPISVPVPNEEVVPYGLSQEGSGFFFPVNEEWSHVMIPEYSRYGDIKEYFVESIKVAIDRLFEIGMTCHGRKVRFRK
jgi:hypothetical protein